MLYQGVNRSYQHEAQTHHSLVVVKISKMQIVQPRLDTKCEKCKNVWQTWVIIKSNA